MFEKVQLVARLVAKTQAQRAQIEEAEAFAKQLLLENDELRKQVVDVAQLRRRVAALKAQNDELRMSNAILRQKLYKLLEEKEA